MRYPFIAGNWKMYKTIAEARAFAEEFKKNISRLTCGLLFALRIRSCRFW